MESFLGARLKHKDINQFSADGASSAIGSIAEYEALSCTTRPNDVQLSVCLAHQHERSGGYASGTITFAEPANKELGGDALPRHQTSAGTWRVKWHYASSKTSLTQFVKR